MVNKTRQALLEILLANSKRHSGEELSRRFGISRVAIWKHIKALQEEGYPVETGHNGYSLTEEKDNLSSLDFSSDDDIRFYRELESTMKTARECLGSPAEEAEDYLILADHQSGGIGRDEKDWNSPSGGIYLTCVLNRSFPLAEVQIMPLRGVLAALKTLEDSGIEGIKFRPPGDILIGERKIGGILEEYHVRDGRVQWYALGLGIHINDSQPDKRRGGISSVTDISGQKILRKEFVRRFSVEWHCLLKDSPDGISSRLIQYKKPDHEIEMKGDNYNDEQN